MSNPLVLMSFLKCALPLLGFGIIAAIFAIYLSNRKGFEPTKVNIDNLAERMTSYARLSNSETVDKSDESSPLLDKGGHAILLGTLKKVENKNASLVTVIVFLMGFILTALVSITIGIATLRINPQPMAGSATAFDVQSLKALALGLAIVSLASLYPLHSAIAGMRQVDQRDFLLLGSSNKLREMQTALMNDLLRKERHFRSARYSVILIVWFVAIAVSLMAALTLR